MENGVIHYVSSTLDTDSALSKNQQKNVETLIHLSDTFHSDAGIHQGPGIPVSNKLCVLESGHQPNFLPYPGVWKKVFLLHRIFGHLKSNDHEVIAVFGFADQNLSTAKLLYENKVPAVNKQGYKKIGFKIQETEKWKCFNRINKPSKDVWENELSSFKDYYFQYLPKNHADSHPIMHTIDTLTEIMEKCYSRAHSMADLNAFIFARICQDFFDVHIHFFRYSDVQQDHLFMNEWKTILASIPLYTTVYNETIREKKLPLTPVSFNFSPFWYHCSCGIKVPLTTDTVSGWRSTCPVCKTEFSLPLNPDNDHLAQLMKDMGLSAVARNVIFSEGLGTRLFISGAGGGLRYGLIANEISRNLSLNIPLTLSWQSRDYYMGIIHLVALKDTLRLFNLTLNDLITGSFDEQITRYRRSLQEHIKTLQEDPENKEEIAKYSGLYRSTATQMNITKKLFSTIPSIIDLLVNFNAPYILHQWNDALNCAEIKDSGEIILVKQDVFYTQDNVFDFSVNELPGIYNSLDVINEL
jgi:hypothetical protein